MALFRLCKRLEPVSDLVEAFVARGACHARIHVGVFVRLACDGGFEVLVGRADGLARGRVAHFLKEFQMAMSMARFAFRCGAEHGGHVIIAFHVGLLGEIEIAAVGLAFARKRLFQIFPSLGTGQRCHDFLLTCLLCCRTGGIGRASLTQCPEWPYGEPRSRSAAPVFKRQQRDMDATLGPARAQVNCLECLQTTFLVFVFAKNYHSREGLLSCSRTITSTRATSMPSGASGSLPITTSSPAISMSAPSFSMKK